MTLNLFDSHFQFEAIHTWTPKETDALLVESSGFSIPIFGAMGCKTGVSEKYRPQSWQRCEALRLRW